MSTFFPQASHFSIQGQTVNFIAGDQNTRIHQMHTGDSHPIVSPGALDRESISEYQFIPRGNLHLLQQISEEIINEKDYSYQRVYHFRAPDKCLTYTRSAYSAQLIGQNLPGNIAVIYEGEDAQAAWERDFLFFSKNHNPNIAHLFGLNFSLPSLVFYNDLIPVRQLWRISSAITRCYIAHRIVGFQENPIAIEAQVFAREKISTPFHLMIIPYHWSTGLFCILPTCSTQDDYGDTPSNIGQTMMLEEPALSPLPIASYGDDSFVLSHYFKWAREDISAELAFQKDISITGYWWQSFDYNPIQTISLAAITSTAAARTPNVVGKFKNLQCRIVDQELLYSSHIKETQDMFETTDKMVEVAVQMERWKGVGSNLGQINRLSSETVLKGWARISYDQCWPHFQIPATNYCHFDHRWSMGIFRTVCVNWNDRKQLSAAWLSQAQYFSDKVNGLYKEILGSAALLHTVIFHLNPDHKNYRSLLHPNIFRIFLFIAPVTVSYLSGTHGTDISWGSDNNLYYWSFDRDGSCPLSKRVTQTLGLPELIAGITLGQQKFEDYQYEATRQFHSLRGYNPSTQQFAEKYGLPLIDIIWLDEKTGPEKDEDPWHDCQETQYKDSDHLHQNPLPQSPGMF
ncbi:hypothetical protein K435DRAFT_857125 [Dendrothele bispora CBS 962.96]|uniref:Uncharacterized protein n=1 Tax=Dendrothele bispora (strain CBS 962.96) TaxID=1314807 RepID=A0A4S8M6R8_DENBC|nr:hypothetical protein K435DRAFT_857125 [Dendrothele bispora CBS 962.96]